MKWTKSVAAVAVVLMLMAVAFGLWSARSGPLGPGEVHELIRLEPVEVPPRPRDRLRVVAVDAEFGARFDPTAPRWPGPATWAELVDTLAHEIALLQPDVLVVFDLTVEDRGGDHVSAAEAIAIEADLTYRVANTTWSAAYAAWPAWPPSAHAGPIDAGHVIYSRLPLTVVDGDVSPATGGLARRTWGPGSGRTHAQVQVGGGAVVDILVVDADTLYDADAPNALRVSRPPAAGDLTDDDGRVGLRTGAAFEVLRPMTHSRLNGSVRGTILYAELAVDLDAPADGSGDTASPTPNAP